MVVRTRGNRPAAGEGPCPWALVWWSWFVLGIMLLWGWGLSQAGTAQPSTRISTRLSTDSVAIGERFTISLVVEHETDTRVEFPASDAGAFVIDDVEVLGRSPVRGRTIEDAREVDSVAYEAATFALDSVRVPALPVQLVSGGDTTIARTPPRTVTVVSIVGPDAKGIHGIASLASFPSPLWTWLLLGLVGSGLLAGLVYLWWRRRRSPETSPIRPQADAHQTPYEAATTWIRQLESYDLSDADAIKPFYVELSNAVRVYLASELKVAALKRTTREVVGTLEHRPDVPPEATVRIQAVLELADLVKFADAHPSPDDHQKALQEARAALDAIETAPRSSTPDAVDRAATAK